MLQNSWVRPTTQLRVMLDVTWGGLFTTQSAALWVCRTQQKSGLIKGLWIRDWSQKETQVRLVTFLSQFSNTKQSISSEA